MVKKYYLLNFLIICLCFCLALTACTDSVDTPDFSNIEFFDYIYIDGYKEGKYAENDKEFGELWSEMISKCENLPGNYTLRKIECRFYFNGEYDETMIDSLGPICYRLESDISILGVAIDIEDIDNEKMELIKKLSAEKKIVHIRVGINGMVAPEPQET